MWCREEGVFGPIETSTGFDGCENYSSLEAVIDQLNDMGSSGWEIVNTVSSAVGTSEKIFWTLRKSTD